MIRVDSGLRGFGQFQAHSPSPICTKAPHAGQLPRHQGSTSLVGLILQVLSGICLLTLLAGCEGRAELDRIHKRLGNSAEGRILPDHEDYYGVDVADKDHAIVVGSYGTILSITEDARKVALQKSGTHSSLFCVSENGAQNALVGGERGLILRTTDAGASWNPIKLPGSLKQNILGFARGSDPRQVWAVGPEGTIIHSADDGVTWEDLSLKKDLNLNAVEFLSDKEGWITGEFGTIMHTADGGHSWEKRDKVSGLPKYVEDVTDEEARHRGIPSLEAQDLYLFKSAFVNPQQGYIVGAGGFVLSTKDSGANWQATHADTRNTLFSMALPKGGSPVASGILGTMTQQKDGRWQLNTETSGSVFTWLRTLSFSPDGSLGMVTGGKGTILISRDGGNSWAPLDRGLLAKAGG
jgi:photosystem II stability/assembly factor-like uncharacterized protein